MALVLAEKKILAISIVASATTMIAGILHLLMVPMSLSHDAGEGVLFLVGGILQVFWAFPVMKRWGMVWQIIGIGGTIVFAGLWFGTHAHMIFGGGPGGGMPGVPPPSGIARMPQVEFFQIAFIGLYAALAVMVSKRQKVAGTKHAG